MRDKLVVSKPIYELVRQLKNAGYIAYIVGGAIRDLMLGREPKDYDISTSATPEEIRAVFGRRNARIIGKRFQLVHVRMGPDIIEISTFRRSPESTGQIPGKARPRPVPENMIFRDNDFGTAEEDAWRRDFTVNALFYDPVNDDLLDYTGCGIDDMHAGIVRSIGEPGLRFEEDPVRVLRALKLVGQYGFTLDPATEAAVRTSGSLIEHTPASRFSLEIEKILKSAYCDGILNAFHDCDFLQYCLPYLELNWNSPPRAYAMQLLAERGRRILEGRYRSSISLAMAVIALPFIEAEIGFGQHGRLWTKNYAALTAIRRIIKEVFQPHNMIKRLAVSAQSILSLQPDFFNPDKKRDKLLHSHGYEHAREMLMLQNAVLWQDERLIAKWPKPLEAGKHPRPTRRKRRRPKPQPRLRPDTAYPAEH
ncbi:MAG: polynucleotide adenylyltransferase PcnB [Victivallaceae bacterium]|nr:polynucleotide adenylyltransferase PcnB [Victivallaceae bacterium]